MIGFELGETAVGDVDAILREQEGAEMAAMRAEVALHDDSSLEECLTAFLLVKQCWNNYTICLANNMTFEKACYTLTEVRDKTFKMKGGQRLSMCAHKLLFEIAARAEANMAVEEAIQKDEEAKVAMAAKRTIRLVH